MHSRPGGDGYTNLHTSLLSNSSQDTSKVRRRGSNKKILTLLSALTITIVICLITRSPPPPGSFVSPGKLFSSTQRLEVEKAKLRQQVFDEFPPLRRTSPFPVCGGVGTTF